MVGLRWDAGDEGRNTYGINYLTSRAIRGRWESGILRRVVGRDPRTGWS